MGTWLVQQLTMGNENQIQENMGQLGRAEEEREGKATVMFSFYDHMCLRVWWGKADWHMV